MSWSESIWEELILHAARLTNFIFLQNSRWSICFQLSSDSSCTRMRGDLQHKPLFHYANDFPHIKEELQSVLLSLRLGLILQWVENERRPSPNRFIWPFQDKRLSSMARNDIVWMYSEYWLKAWDTFIRVWAVGMILLLFCSHYTSNSRNAFSCTSSKSESSSAEYILWICRSQHLNCLRLSLHVFH